jgi:hypothetical protein
VANLTEKQALDLAGDFLVLSHEIGQFRINNREVIEPSDNLKLANWQWLILNTGEDIVAYSTTLVMDDVLSTLSLIEKVTSQIKDTIQTMKDIQKGINIAAGIVTLGSSILSGNPLVITESINGLLDIMNI